MAASEAAWVDFDHDAVLDLALATIAITTPCLLFLDIRDGAQTTPFWESAPINCEAMAWGDIDGDTDLDAVFVSYYSRLLVYKNDGTTLVLTQDVPNIVAGYPTSARLVDVDGDGLPDLACGVNGGRTCVFANDAGRIDVGRKLWESSIVLDTWDFDWADINGDTVPDLLSANSTGPIAVYRSRGGALEDYPSWSTNRDFRAFYCQWVDFDNDGDLDVSVGVHGNGMIYENREGLFDQEPVWSTPEVYTIGGLAWADFDSDGDQDLMMGDYYGNLRLYRNIGGAEYLKLALSRNYGGTINDIAFDDCDGDGDPDVGIAFGGRSLALRNNEGTLIPFTREVYYPEATIGDSTASTVMFQNRDRQALRLQSVQFASDSFRPAGAFEESLATGILVASGDTVGIDVAYQPTVPGSERCVMEVRATNPLVQTTRVELNGTARGLDFVLPPLHPDGIVHLGSDVRFALMLLGQANSDLAVLAYRGGGQEAFRDTAMARAVGEGNTYYSLNLPRSMLVDRGVEYYYRLFNGQCSQASSVKYLQMEFDQLDFPAAVEPERYQLVSLPFHTESPIMGVLEDDVGGVDRTQWRLLGWGGEDGWYVDLPSQTATGFALGDGYWFVSRRRVQLTSWPAIGVSTRTDQPFVRTLTPGRNLMGVPFNFPVWWDSCLVDGQPAFEAEGVLVEPPVAYGGENNWVYDVEKLEPFVGYWVKNITETDVLLEWPPKEAVSAGGRATRSRQRPGWGIEITATCGSAVDAGNLAWVSEEGVSGRDRIDRSEMPPCPGRALSLSFVGASSDKGMSGRLQVDCRGRRESEAAVAAGAGIGHRWPFDVAKNFQDGGAGDLVKLTFARPSTMPANVQTTMIDRELGNVVDLMEQPTYTCVLGTRDAVVTEEACRFLLLVGDREYTGEQVRLLATPPATTTLHQNRPNPCNPSTVIRFDVSRRGAATLRVYNVAGALVGTVFSGAVEPGSYEFTWPGIEEQDRHRASGVYFYRLETSWGHRETKKLTLLK